MCSHTSRLVHSCFWLRCLIYKVQAPSSRTALIDYHIFRSLSSTFFKVFQTFQTIYRFSAFQPAALADSLIRLPHSPSFVKHFFYLINEICRTLQMLKVWIWYQMQTILSRPFSTFPSSFQNSMLYFRRLIHKIRETHLNKQGVYTPGPFRS